MKLFLLRREIIGLLWLALTLGSVGCSGGSADVEEAVEQEETSQEDGDVAEESSGDEVQSEIDEAASNEDIDSYEVGQENNLNEMEKSEETANQETTEQLTETTPPADESAAEVPAAASEDDAVLNEARALAEESDKSAEAIASTPPVDVAEVEPETESNEAEESLPIEDKAPEVAAVPESSQPESSYEPSPAAVEGEGRYITQPGDSLSRIASKLFGNAGRWQELASLSNINRPEKIYPGDVIRFQVTSETKSFDSAYSGIKMKTVTVQKGDSLSEISKRLLGSGNNWKYLWRFNEEKIANPDKLEIGQVISYISREQMTAFAPRKARKSGQKTH